MILLNKGTLSRKDVILPEKMSLDIEERNSRAVMELGPEAPGATIGDWMVDDTDPGKGIVWRVAALEPTYETETRRVTLEHIISELKDTIIFGELALHGSAENALRTILGMSQHWRLGSCEYDVSLPYEFDGDTLFEAVETICETLEDSWWDYDLSAVPFKLHVRKLGSGVGSEMRAGRNIKTIRKTIDKNGMYTRFYPIGKEELRLSGTPYVSRNEDKYGIISETETNQAIDSEDMLRAWAQGRVRRHSDPTVTVTVAGLELADSTGESLDRFRIMTMCRVPIPEIGETITERITKLSYPDKIGKRENVTVTMSNKTQDATTITEKIRQEAQKARSGGRAGGKKAEEDHAWFTDTADHVSMTAEAIVGKNPDGTVDWSRVSDITVNGDGIYSTVTKTERDLVTAKSAIEQTETAIRQTVQAVGADGKITAASICLAIRNGSSEAYISADRIRLDGSTSIRQLLTGQATIGQLKVSDLRVQAQGGMGFISVANCINTALVTNNELKLYRMNGELVATFSKATTQDGAWSGNITAGKSYKVEAKQNGQVVHTHYSPALDGYYTGTKSWASDYKSVDVPVTVYDEDGTDLFRDTLNIDTSAAWQRGHDSAYPNSRSLTYNRSETLPSGTTRYHYYTTGSPIHTSGSLTVHW